MDRELIPEELEAIMFIGKANSYAMGGIVLFIIVHCFFMVSLFRSFDTYEFNIVIFVGYFISLMSMWGFGIYYFSVRKSMASEYFVKQSTSGILKQEGGLDLVGGVISDIAKKLIRHDTNKVKNALIGDWWPKKRVRYYVYFIEELVAGMQWQEDPGRNANQIFKELKGRGWPEELAFNVLDKAYSEVERRGQHQLSRSRIISNSMVGIVLAIFTILFAIIAFTDDSFDTYWRMKRIAFGALALVTLVALIRKISSANQHLE